MIKKLSGFLILSFFVVLIKLEAQTPASFADIDIPYKKFVLDNGLTVIIHEDHKAPVVAINIWYHVGSKNEKSGKTGFAHLFEHLMFNGSEHFNDDYFKVLDKIGATDLNGTTSNDRTNYFETVPTSAFEQVLWLESDRMGYMVNAISQAKLDEQRGVVQNEKRQGENEPYGLVDEYMTKSVYPAAHPYSWTVIGSMEDLNAASLDDVKEWFKTYYGPNNATLVIAGDVKTDEALEKVKKYFGGLQAGPPVVKYQQWPAKRSGVQRQVMQDRVPQIRIYKVWNVPQDGNWEYKMLDLASDVLASGKNSRFYKRLVYTDQIATRVSCYLDNREIGSLFTIEADVKPGIDKALVEKAIDEELDKFLKSGPTEEELQRVKTANYASFIRGLERVGGFGGKSDILASNQTYFGDPDYHKTLLKYMREAKVADIQSVSNKWLTDGQYILEVDPFTEAKTEQADADRSKMPELGVAPDLKLPGIQREKLSNGLTIVLSQNKSIPVVQMLMSFNAGYVTDKFTVPGTAKLAMNMLDEGTKTRDALKISEELGNLGTNLNTSAGLDQSFVSMNSLKVNLDKSLDIFSDIILNPSFPDKDFERLKKEQVVNIQKEKVQPFSIALRILPKYLFGENHPYNMPLTGSGFETSVPKITKESLQKFKDTWLVPNNATLIVVGDITMDEIKPKIEALFKNWKQNKCQEITYPVSQAASKPVIYLMDRPGSIQSIVLAGSLAGNVGSIDEATLSVMNSIIGGEFTSRLNMNLREDKHWSYGAGTFVYDTKAQRPFLAYTSVQSDKTKETVQEMNRELTEYVSKKPATEDEVIRNQNNELLQFAGKYETMRSVMLDINDIVKYNFKDTYPQDYYNMLKSVTVKDVQNMADKVINPQQLCWVIVGDKAKIEAPLKEVGFEIKFIDADGNLIEK